MRQLPTRRTGARPTPRTIAVRYATLFYASRRWLVLMVIVFVASIVAGIIGARENQEFHKEFLGQVGESMAPALALLRQGDTLGAIVTIFWRNLSILLVLLGAGALVWPLLFGFPIVAFAGNGYLLGVVIALSEQPPARLAAALIPHALFELPALVIAAAWSLKMSVAWLLPAAAGRRGDVWRETVMEGLWIIPLATVLLIIAAVIEVVISGPLARTLGT